MHSRRSTSTILTSACSTADLAKLKAQLHINLVQVEATSDDVSASPMQLSSGILAHPKKDGGALVLIDAFDSVSTWRLVREVLAKDCGDRSVEQISTVVLLAADADPGRDESKVAQKTTMVREGG